MTLTLKSHDDIRRQRLREPSFRCGWIVAAPLWPKNGDNLGTLARTCDALSVCIAVPRGAAATNALRRGNTIGHDKVCLHHVDGDPVEWLRNRRRDGRRLLAVELCAGAMPLRDLAETRAQTIVVIGHEARGVPQEALDLCHQAVEIPMRGVGNSLNVTVAASLVLYRLGGAS